ncbi:MAG: GGDEF domain-containing protein [Candidatus Omnitrophica bacterium]|nr:GGDEF domain-containing protein [Candidatus Omnitrophota bacterium]
MGQLTILIVAVNLLVLGVVYFYVRRRYKRIINSLYTQSITDGLTQLHDRRYFDMRLNEEVERVRRYGMPVSLLMIDIDDFKQYNDTYGHPAGDKLLRRISDIIRHGTRRIDLSARYGGEEFAVMLPVTPMTGAKIAAERLRARVEESSRAEDKAVTISIGVSTYDGEPKDYKKDTLVKSADEALYRAKDAGKNCVHLSSEATKPMEAAE